MLSEERQREMYNRIGNLPVAWYNCFDRLLTASELLFNQIFKINDEGSINDSALKPRELEVFSVVKMLRAMALEDLFKALWLKSGEELVNDGEYKKIPNTNDHNLIFIADKVSEKIDCEINAPERDLLKRLSLSITGGRYPIQSSWVNSKIQKYFGGGFGPPGVWHFPKDEKLFDTLVERLKKIFEENS
ncbi:MAG: hypothetical protein JXB48_24125 [Candidatus Latescibacteria bacterium]|nr:hypothetical protein [Candidatus Latescibacterota bacterium]